MLACAGTSLTGKEQQHPVLIATPVPALEPESRALPAASASATEAEPAAPPFADEVSDPQPLAQEEQWQYELAFADGTVRVERVSLRVFERPVVTARHVGRFAIELWIGRELIERVRFDFPLLGAEVPVGERRAVREPARFEPGLHALRTVLVPNSARAVRAQLVDRATGSATPLPWPPNAPLAPVIPKAEASVAEPAPAPIPE